jgi:hypothetical protein
LRLKHENSRRRGASQIVEPLLAQLSGKKGRRGRCATKKQRV